jgi:hypothetical protein
LEGGNSLRRKWIAGLVGLLIVVLIGVLYVIVTPYDFNELFYDLTLRPAPTVITPSSWAPDF